MDVEGYDRSPVDRDRDSRRRGRSRSRSRTPPPPASSSRRHGRSRSRSVERDHHHSHRRSGRSRSRSRSPPRRGSTRGGEERERERDRDRDRDSDRRRRDPSPGGYRGRGDEEEYPHSSTRGGYGGGAPSTRGSYRGGRGGSFSSSRPTDVSTRSTTRESAAQEAIKNSVKANRVYVGNLSFQVRWHDLKEHCSSVGTVVFAEIITLPNGMSKGCGIVEYSTREEAERAVRDLNETELMGRQVYLREDREDDARFGAAAVSHRATFPGAPPEAAAGGGRYSSARGGPPPPVPAVFAPPGPRGLWITGMTDSIGWQDLKDLFRAAGTVVRADINIDHSTGLSKGTGVVVMESKAEAEAAIAMFNGYEFDGGRLDVREDRFYHINAARGAANARGRGAPRGGFRGGHDSSYHSGRNTDNLYGDYNGPDASQDAEMSGGGGNYREEYSGGRGGFGGGRGGYSSFRGGRGGYGNSQAGRPFEPRPAAPSTQIFVQNLPWSTANEDLVELFQTTGTVVHAEVLWQDGRSKGNGVVQFASIEEAETAIAKFQNYQYGGRGLGLAFNARWKDFGAGGGHQNGGEEQHAMDG